MHALCDTNSGSISIDKSHGSAPEQNLTTSVSDTQGDTQPEVRYTTYSIYKYEVESIHLNYVYPRILCMLICISCNILLQAYRQFLIHEESHTFGVRVKGKKGGFQYQPKSNFIIILETYVEAGASSGFLARIARTRDTEFK